jgi:predicted amidohydrolase
MSMVRIALANLRFPPTPDASVALAEEAIGRAGAEGAAIICFPECYVPGYRAPNRSVPAADAAFLERAWSSIAAVAGKAGVAVVLGTERVADDGVMATTLIVDRDGTRLGFQDKVQVDPSEDTI